MPPTVKTDMISLFSRLRPNQFTMVQSYPLVSIYSNIHIIGLILAAGKNSKIAIMRSCHPVSVWSANMYVYATNTYPNQSYGSLPTWYVQLRTLKLHTQLLVPNLHYHGYFPYFISILSNLYTTIPYPVQSDIAVYSITVYCSELCWFHSALKLKGKLFQFYQYHMPRLIPYRYTMIRG